MICSKKYSNIILKIMWYVFLAVVISMLLFDVFAMILMIIKSTFGYCNPWMSEIINFELRVLEQMREIPW